MQYSNFPDLQHYTKLNNNQTTIVVLVLIHSSIYSNKMSGVEIRHSGAIIIYYFRNHNFGSAAFQWFGFGSAAFQWFGFGSAAFQWFGFGSAAFQWFGFGSAAFQWFGFGSAAFQWFGFGSAAFQWFGRGRTTKNKYYFALHSIYWHYMKQVIFYYLCMYSILNIHFSDIKWSNLMSVLMHDVPNTYSSFERNSLVWHIRTNVVMYQEKVVYICTYNNKLYI